MPPEPFPHQREGIKFLVNGGLALTDDPGLGKSAQVLLAAAEMGVGTILTVCPAIAVGVWPTEAAKFRPDLSVLTVRDALKLGKIPRENRMLVVSYDHLVASEAVRDLISAVPHDLLILDEAHQLKNPVSKRTLLIYGAGCARGPNSLIDRCGTARILTGTPVLNHVGETFPHLRALAPERIDQRSYAGFVDYYCLKGIRTVRTRTGRSVNVETIEGSNRTRLPELAKRMRGFWLKRRIESVLQDLPPLRVEVRRLPAEMLDVAALARVENSDEAKQIRDAIKSGGPAALRNLEGHTARLRRLLALAKVPAVVAWAEGALDAGEPKIAVFGWHVEALEQIYRKLRAYDGGTVTAPPVMITGASSPRQREAAVAQFQENQACRVGVFQIQAAGTALTMTACRRVLMAEQAWVPALNDQAIRRCYRIGSTNAVLAEVLCAPGLDETVQGVLARKLGDTSLLEE